MNNKKVIIGVLMVAIIVDLGSEGYSEISNSMENITPKALTEALGKLSAAVSMILTAAMKLQLFSIKIK